jgi:hypothetical protein
MKLIVTHLFGYELMSYHGKFKVFNQQHKKQKARG